MKLRQYGLSPRQLGLNERNLRGLSEEELLELGKRIRKLVREYRKEVR